MRLKTSIFLWVSLATLVPLTALVLGATVYSQHLYQNEVDREVRASLESIIAEINRRLVFEREMLQGLVDAPPVQQYLPVLTDASASRVHPEFYERTGRINRFLVAFQDIVSSLNTLRVLDGNGNTLVKVRGGRSSPAIFDGIESFPYAEEELDHPGFLSQIRTLTPNEVGVTLLTQTREEQDEQTSMPMLDYIIPLAEDGEVIGYLTANLRGEQIDRILDLAPRLHKGQLLIAEVNPDQRERNGLVLYDDARALRFSDIKSTNVRLQDIDSGILWDTAQVQFEGEVRSEDNDSVTYFAEYLPYPNLLSNWVVATRIDLREITAPFERIRVAIALFASAALLVSLWFVNLSAGRIARPVARLADTLKAYADGRYQERVGAEDTEEVNQLGQAFNYMADTLDRARGERDKAQNLLLQNDKLVSLGQMAAGIGHELNNPLNNILSYSKLIQRGLPADDPALRRDVESVREETLRASQIVKGILNFARQVPPQYSHFNIDKWLGETLVLVRQAAREKGVELVSHVHDDYTAHGDRGQLQQALVNLLLNAIQASPRGSRVVADVHRDDGELVVRVQDQGPGIEPGQLDKIFDPFFTTKPVGEGSGLGLSISLGIVERHGGRLTVENSPQGGVVARIILPYQEVEAA